ncbi:MAG: hypothetical protein ABW122_04095 [Ilumatobacteraceae bacterium]
MSGPGRTADERIPDAPTLARAAIDTAGRGDAAAAAEHLEQARAVARAHARRDRQVVEIAAAIVGGDPVRAIGLAAEHRHEFPDDAPLLDELLGGRPASGVA